MPLLQRISWDIKYRIMSIRRPFHKKEAYDYTYAAKSQYKLWNNPGILSHFDFPHFVLTDFFFALH